ncbi:hypothetical protein ANN_05682 [Periplaneta americana]|uniref:Uncharacterized protein n=1 Tax=Periplaneta americana TaxID=6978 RepID=A0ABQ8TDZ3_PERAM|nr:hypothetical protein ANN_05682 [Periplaneta americana]
MPVASSQSWGIPDILNPVLDEVWLEQYELCTAHFNKMEATDVLSFIKGTCFDERGVAMMSIECRMTILTRTKEYCQLKLIYPLEDEADEWSEAAKQLDIWLAHLKVVSSSGALQFCRSSKKDGERLLRMLDLSMGEMSGVAELLREAVLSELSLESLQHLMRLLPEPAPTLEDLLKEAVQLVRNGEEPKGSHLLSAVLRRLQENLKYAASSAVPQEVETLCGDPNLTPEIRLQALELLQSLRPHEVHSDTVLLYRHTQASVATAWSQVPISIQETDLQTPESRAQLFSRLLAHAHTWQQILILKDLLDKWPNFKDSSDSSTNPWMQLIYKIITFDDRKMDEVESVLDDVFQHNNFSPGDLQYLVSLGEGNVDLSLLLLVCLLPDHSALHATAVSLVQKHLRADDPKLTDRLRTLLLQRGLAPALVATPAYPQMIEHLLLGCACDLPSWSTVAGQLIANGNVAEAGSVLMLQRGVSPALAVFSSDIKIVGRSIWRSSNEKTQVYAWHKRFSVGRDSIKDDARSGRPTTATNEAIAQRVRNVVRDDRRKTIKEIAAEVGISVESVHNVLHKHLNMHYVSQKLVPKMLSAEQKETRMTLAGDMISMADEDSDFLNKIIAGDETWSYLYDPVRKRQSSEWKSKTSPRKQKFPRDTSKGKVMLEVFFDSQGLIHHEFIPEGRTVMKELYVEILRRLREAVRRKRPEKWVENNWFLMHDNAPAHRAIIVKNFLATALDHPPYSPDLSPPDYFLFPRLKSHLKGRRFNAEELSQTRREH